MFGQVVANVQTVLTWPVANVQTVVAWPDPASANVLFIRAAAADRRGRQIRIFKCDRAMWMF